MKCTFFIRMSYLHAMPITNITHNACYTVEMGVSASDLTRITLGNNHTAYMQICVCQKLPSGNDATMVINACNVPSLVLKIKMVQPSSKPHFLLPLLHHMEIK